MEKTVENQDIPAVVHAAVEKHGGSREAIIPILSEINSALGYIPAEAFQEVKRQVQTPEDQVFVSESQLFSMASFYHMLSTKPMGRHVVQFCESAPCHVVGGRKILLALQDALQIKAGETSQDKKWSLVTTSCLGLCDMGPVILIDEDLYSNLKADQIPGILARYE